MPIPSVKGYMPLCVTLRSRVCDEQGVGQWPMWKRYDSVKGIVDQYVDEPYRDFLALPYFEVDKQKSEEYFYWYTPRSDTDFCRLNRTGDDHDFYKALLDKTIAHYHSVIEHLKSEGKAEEANFLELSLKYAGDSESNVYCGDGRVVVTVWGMRPREGRDLGESILFADLFPEKEMHTVRYDLGNRGATANSTILKKSHGTRIYAHQVPFVKAKDGYEFIGWDRNPLGAEVTSDLLFVAQYNEPVEDEKPKSIIHHVRFLTPDSKVITETDVEHGKQISADFIPQLPVVDGIVCPAWDGNPLNDVINANRDYKAIAPNPPKKLMHTVRFLTPEGNVLTQFRVEHGTQLASNQVPSLPVMNGETCPGWSSDPLAEKILEDRDFTAKMPEKKEPKKKEPIITGRGGFWRALFNWLLLALGLLLLFLLLWLFLLGKGNFDFCGCGCTEPIGPPGEGTVTPVQHPCNTEQHAGGVEGYLGYFDMGQQKGTFPFEFNTYNIPDKVTVYDGKGTSGKIIYSYEGGSLGMQSVQLSFSNRWVTVKIEGSSYGTSWVFNTGCPNN